MAKEVPAKLRPAATPVSPAPVGSPAVDKAAAAKLRTSGPMAPAGASAKEAQVVPATGQASRVEFLLGPVPDLSISLLRPVLDGTESVLRLLVAPDHIMELVRNELAGVPARADRAALAERCKVQNEALQDGQGGGSTRAAASSSMLAYKPWQELRKCLANDESFQKFGQDWCETELQRRLAHFRHGIAAASANDKYVDLGEQRTLADLAKTLGLKAQEAEAAYQEFRQKGVNFPVAPALHRSNPTLTSPEALVRLAESEPASAQKALEDAVENEQLDAWFARLMLQGHAGHVAAVEATNAYHAGQRLPATKRVGVWKVLWQLGFSGLPLDERCQTVVHTLSDLQAQLRKRPPIQVLGYGLEWGLLEAWLRAYQKRLGVEETALTDVRKAASSKMSEQAAWRIAWQLGATHLEWGPRQLTDTSELLGLDPDSKLPDVNPALFLSWLLLGLREVELVASLAHRRQASDDLQRTLRRTQWALGKRELKVGAFVAAAPDSESVRQAALHSPQTLVGLGEAVLGSVIDDWLASMNEPPHAAARLVQFQLRAQRSDALAYSQSTEHRSKVLESLRAAALTAHQAGLAALWCLGETSLPLWASGEGGKQFWLQLGSEQVPVLEDLVARSGEVWPVAALPDAVEDLELWRYLDTHGLELTDWEPLCDGIEDFLAHHGDTTLRFVTGVPLSKVGPSIGGLRTPASYARKQLTVWLANSPGIPHALRVLFHTGRLQAWLARHAPELANELSGKLEGICGADTRLDIVAQVLGARRLTLAEGCIVETVQDLVAYGPRHFGKVAELFKAGALTAWAAPDGALRLQTLANELARPVKGGDDHRKLRHYLLDRNLGALAWAAATGEGLAEASAITREIQLTVPDGPAILHVPFSVAKPLSQPTEVVLSSTNSGRFEPLFWVSTTAVANSGSLEIPWLPTSAAALAPQIVEFTLSSVGVGGEIVHQTVNCKLTVRYPWARLRLALRDVLTSTPQIALRLAALWLGTWAFLALGETGLAKTWTAFKVWTPSHFGSLAGFALWSTWTGLALGECFAERTGVWPTSSILGTKDGSESIGVAVATPIMAYLALVVAWITSLSPVLAWAAYEQVNWHVGTLGAGELWLASLIASLPLGLTVPAYAILKTRGFTGVGGVVLACGIAVHVAPWLGY